jgi:hypothetical protein
MKAVSLQGESIVIGKMPPGECSVELPNDDSSTEAGKQTINNYKF